MNLSSQRRRGFTLVEIMISMSIFGVIMLGALTVYMQALNIYSYDEGKIQVNRDIRSLTMEMAANATYANYFLIYPDFSTRTTTTTTTDPVTGATTTKISDLSVNDGVSGDMLVLIFNDDADDTKVSRLIGYYRAPTGSINEGPVRRFDITISPSSSAAVNTLLPAVSTLNTNQEVVQISVGLADGKLFYNLFDRSVMVKGQIIHRGSLTKRAINTYNFTISPRG
jgi:prepilin-type N-terminal cleavage/methylation domain-containing protein